MTENEENKKPQTFEKIKSQRRSDALNRFKKQFRIYYKSHYGKAGFYILLIFGIIALLSPIIAPQPYSYVAPTVDTHAANMRFEVNLTSDASSSQFLPMSASSSATTGSYIVSFATTSGKIYAAGLGGSSSTPINSTTLLATAPVNSTNAMLDPTIVSFSDYHTLLGARGALVLQNFLLWGTTNGTLSISEITWTGGQVGYGSPQLSANQTMAENGSLLYTPIGNSQRISQLQPGTTPFYDVASVTAGLGTTAKLFTETHNATGYYLNEFGIYPSLHQVWSTMLSHTVKPGKISYYGSYFTSESGTSVVVSVGNQTREYSAASGSMVWNKTFASPVTLNAPYIPSKYQFQQSSSNSVFVATANNNVYGVSLSNGSAYKVLNTTQPVLYLDSSPGSSGFPSTFVTETANHAYLTAVNSSGSLVTSEFSLISGHGSYSVRPIYDKSAATYIFGTNQGFLISMKTPISGYPYTWSATLSHKGNMTNPLLFYDASTGRDEIGIISQAGYMYAYDATAHDLNPIPPTLHTPTGNVFLFGTNIDGQDVFSQFIQSFGIDWEIGLSIGFAVLVIGLFVAMIVGYMGGVVGSFFETVSLTIFLIPGLALLIALASVLGSGYLTLIFIVTVISWPFTTFTLIGLVRQIKSRAFVEAAKLSGARTPAILRRHIMPNILPLLLYLLAISISGAIAGVSTLQFLGIAPLTAATWGGMLSPMLGNFFLAVRAPWWVLPPSTALTMFIFAFIFVSRGMDEVANPRLRRR